jgi:hypothetical protein
MSRFLIRRLILAAALLSAGIAYAHGETLAQKRLEWESLARTLATLEKRTTIESWDAGLFIASGALNTFAKTYEGLKIEFNEGLPGYAGATATLRTVTSRRRSVQPEEPSLSTSAPKHRLCRFPCKQVYGSVSTG